MEILLQLIDRILLFFWIAIIARALLSWVVPMSGGRPHPTIITTIRVLNQVTEPILAPIRQLLVPIQQRYGVLANVDLSPMAAMLLIWLIQIGIGKL